MDKREKIQFILVFAVDSVSLFISCLLSWLVLDHLLNVLLVYEGGEIFQFFFLLALAFLITFLGFNSAEGLTTRAWKAELLAVIQKNIILASALAVVLIISKIPLMESRYLYVGIFGSNILLEFALHQWLKHWLSRAFYKGNWATLVGVVTTRDRAEALLRGIKGDWSKKVIGVAVVDATPALVGQKISSVPVTATFPDFMDWIRGDSLDEVYVDLPYDTGQSLTPYVQELESMGLVVHINVPTLEQYLPHDAGAEMPWMPRLQRTIDEVAGVPLVTLSSDNHPMSQLIIKRMMDIVGAVVGLIIAAPIIAVTAIPLKLESPGPLFFKQQRVGLNGRIFFIYKLRSMYQDAEQRKRDLMEQNKMQGLMFKVDNDPRITKVGKFIRKTSIDELPQFWNVLKGEMSLVGTRPPTLDEYEQYKSHHKRRLSMKPGITGMWQVSGRSNIEDFEEVVKLDIRYIDNWSLKLDVKILLKTVEVVAGRVGAE